MVEGLLLDRIHAEAARAAVGRQDDLAVFAGAHETHPPLPLLELAEAGAHLALHAQVLHSVAALGRHDGWLGGCAPLFSPGGSRLSKYNTSSIVAAFVPSHAGPRT